LCATRVLDPACGTANFLYVSLELMKTLEAEVLETLVQLGEAESMGFETVDPHQFLGIELNPRAAAIAELVLWLGYLQQHYRSRSGHPAEPILKAFHNIENRDAVLTWDGYPVTTVVEKDGVRVETYPNARRPEWPEAEFIVGNPPFLGKGAAMRGPLGDNYVDALRSANPGVHDGSDFVMYWWGRSADIILSKGSKLRRFGLVTTNSISQTFNRRIIDKYLKGKKSVSLIYAVPDQPWTKATRDAAAVRISMTVAEVGKKAGTLAKLSSEIGLETEEPVLEFFFSEGKIHPDLSVGPNISGSKALKSNEGLASMGPALGSRGFVIDKNQKSYLDRTLNEFEKSAIFPLRNGDDLLYTPRGIFVPILSEIDSEEELRQRAPHLYQILREGVYPARSVDRDPRLRKYWWKFRRANDDYFGLKSGLRRYAATVETAKHRIFFFVSGGVLVEHGNIAFGTDDAYLLSVMTSKIHVKWSLASGGTLEDRPRYNKVRTFDPFPFPDPSEDLKASLRALGEELDATRKTVLADHADLTLTGLYNLLEKVRAKAELTPIEQDQKTRGRVLILKELHDHIDAATADAYGWPRDLTDEQILERLVALNAERAREEAAGHVRWLRPDYQIPRFARGAAAKSGDLDLGEALAAADDLPDFPKDAADRPAAVLSVLDTAAAPLDVAAIARSFNKGGKRIEQAVVKALPALVRYGHVTALKDGRYAGRKAA